MESCLVGSIPRKPLSIVLSFLTECEGTCLLLTNKYWSKAILPSFEVPNQQHDEGQLVVVVDHHCSNTSTSSSRRNTKLVPRRHKFVPFPVEDPETLLARVNTKRLYQRIKYYKKTNLSTIKSCSDCHSSCSYYQRNRTTEELADYEHQLLGLLVTKEPSNHATTITTFDTLLRQQLVPAHLELVRFRKSKMERLPHPTHGNYNPENDLTVLASYPRSGNSLLRSLVERVTGCVTGSDTRPDRTLSRQLANDHDMVGEGMVTPSRVYVTKTHFPERRGWKVIRYPQRIILLTRNPFDAIDSYFHMALTNTHTKTLADSIYIQYATMFHQLATSEIQVWKQFHEYWIHPHNANKSKNTINNASSVTTASPMATTIPPPMLIVRYEDLLLRPHESMMRVVAFLLGLPLLSPNERLPSFWEQRILHVLGPNPRWNKVTTLCIPNNSILTSSTTNNEINDEQKVEEEKLLVHQLGSYKPRSAGMIGKSLGRFANNKLLEDMHSVAGPMLGILGYNVFTQNFPDNMNQMPKRERVVLNYKAGMEENATLTTDICINIGTELRAPDNPYGRNITAWRKSQTMGDSKPMPTK
jgi:hypothetical protein